MNNSFKIKPLTKEQIIISLDRLTRFKPTEEKYLRVFKDIITSNLIYPKYKKAELNLMDYGELTKIVEEIFDCSLKSLNCHSRSGLLTRQYEVINKKLLEYEKSVFKFDKNVEKLLKNKIDYVSAINLIGGMAIPPYNNIPINLKWLKSLTKDDNQIENRTKISLKFPLEKIIIAEGITEEILLPKFAKLCGVDFDKKGIHIISAGGKNQVVRLFYQFADILNLPIFVLLDSDAKENFEEIQPKLRKGDKVYVLPCGEFEDTLPLNLIKRTLNQHFKNHFSVSLDDLRKEIPMTKTLEEVFKNFGQEFKKAEFATLVGGNIKNGKDLSDEIKKIVLNIKE